MTMQNVGYSYDGWDDEPRPRSEELSEAQAVAARKSPITRRGYAYDFGTFSRWCAENDVESMPATPTTVAEYIRVKSTQCPRGKNAPYAYNTLTRFVSAIDHYHALNVYRVPGRSRCVTRALANAMYTNPLGKKRKAFTVDDIVRILDSMSFTAGRASLGVFRDAAIILVGFGGGYRRGEISGFKRRDINFGIDGVVITLPRSKTDQIGVGRVGGIFRSGAPRYCAPCALARWMVLSDAYALGRTDLDKLLQKLDPAKATKHLCKKALKFHALLPDSPVFRSFAHSKITKNGIPAADVNRAVQRHSVPLGYPASEYGTHSLRAGFVTTALDNGATVEEVMRQTGHKSPAMVMQYYRSHVVLSLNAGRRVTINGKRNADTKIRQVALEPHASKKPKARRKSEPRRTKRRKSDGRVRAAAPKNLTSMKVKSGVKPTRE